MFCKSANFIMLIFVCNDSGIMIDIFHSAFKFEFSMSEMD